MNELQNQILWLLKSGVLRETRTLDEVGRVMCKY